MELGATMSDLKSGEAPQLVGRDAVAREEQSMVGGECRLTKEQHVKNPEKTKKLQKRKRSGDDGHLTKAMKKSKIREVRSPRTAFVTSLGINLLMSSQARTSSPVRSPSTRVAELVQGKSPQTLPMSSQARASSLVHPPSVRVAELVQEKSPQTFPISSQARTSSPTTPCCTIHFSSPRRSPSLVRSPSPAMTSHGSRHRPRRLTSKVWRDADPIRRDGKVVEAKCIHCHKNFSCSQGSGTTLIGRHLKVCSARTKVHSLVDKMHSSITSPETLVLQDWHFDKDLSRKELVRMIVRHELPFSFVEYEGFKSFAASLNPLFTSMSRTTAHDDCIRYYDEHKLALRDAFKNCTSRMSFDC